MERFLILLTFPPCQLWRTSPQLGAQRGILPPHGGNQRLHQHFDICGKGYFFYGSHNKTPNLFWRRVSNEKPLLQIFLFVRTPGVWQSSFSHPACAENWKLHECSEYSIQGMWNVPCLKILEAYSVCLITGWVRRQCNRLPNGFFVEVGRHQSKQTRNESYALCCDGTCILSLYATLDLFANPKIFLSQFLITLYIIMCLDFITAIPEGRFDPS